MPHIPPGKANAELLKCGDEIHVDAVLASLVHCRIVVDNCVPDMKFVPNLRHIHQAAIRSICLVTFVYCLQNDGGYLLEQCGVRLVLKKKIEEDRSLFHFSAIFNPSVCNNGIWNVQNFSRV